MAFRLRLIKENTNIDFMGWHKAGFAMSLGLVVLTFFLLFTKGLNFGIDFTGGVLMEVKGPDSMKVETVRGALSGLSTGTPTIQESGDHTFMIKVPGREADTETQKALYAEVEKALGDGVDFRRVEYVGPQVGRDLIVTGIKAFIYSMLGIMIYMWFRYEWRFGFAGVVSLAHDVVATVLFFLIFNVEFDLSTVAAVLLVAGYSVNDTVIIFDRIREKLRKFRKMPLADVINIALNETLSRTVITTVSTLAVMVVLVFFGNKVIEGFVYAMIVGVIVGTWSSVFVAAPLLLYLRMDRDAVGSGAPEPEDTAQQAG